MAPTATRNARSSGGQANAKVVKGDAKPSEPAVVDTTDCQCPICFESYDIGPSPVHSPAALRCGHVFGEKCVRQWITQAQKAAKPLEKPICPSCQKDTAISEVLPLFADFKVLDSANEIKKLRAAHSTYLAEYIRVTEENKRLVKENKNLQVLNSMDVVAKQLAQCNLLTEENKRQAVKIKKQAEELSRMAKEIAQLKRLNSAK